MQRLFGRVITDRASVIQANGQYLGYFDKVHVCTEATGRDAVDAIVEHIAVERFKREQAEREAREAEIARIEKMKQDEIDGLKNRLMLALQVESEVIDDLVALTLILARKVIEDKEDE